MLKRRRNRGIIQGIAVVTVSLLVIFTAIAVSSIKYPGLLSWLPGVRDLISLRPRIDESELEEIDSDVVFSLVSAPPEERQSILEDIATATESSLPAIERGRARYFLAAEALAQGDPETALTWLEDLSSVYTPMSAYVLAQRARAYTALDDPAQALETWQTLWQRYPQEAVAAEALYALGAADPNSDYWDIALETFPSHPRSVDIAQARLAEDPDQLELMLILARHGLYLSDIDVTLNRLLENYGSQLEPEDWEAIAFGFWENGLYDNAGRAYENAPATALNRYRAGRGAHLGNRQGEARRAYQQLAQEFPNEPDTAQGLLHLASLTDNSQEAIAYLDTVINTFPDRAADALLAKADRLEQLQSPQSALQIRESVLADYSQSEAAADLRWQQIERRFQNGDIEGAWNWAKQLVEENPGSDYAAEAAFWVGKWAVQLGQPEEAQQAFEYVLRQYPESYYAWRSAVLLGWDVGNFNTVRDKAPTIENHQEIFELPAGSTILQELHRLDQRDDAWALWQVEYETEMQPSVAEQLTDGILRLGVGDNLEGIFMLESLAWRDDPEDQADYRYFRQQVNYWQAIYPFLFLDPIQTWADDRGVNPLLVISLMRQESRFESKIRSSAGAVGLMQVLPETADWIAGQTDIGDYVIDDVVDSIKLGTWYLAFTHREYDNNSMLAIASYNAGPGNVADWLVRFGISDPDLFVEEIPFPETKGYVEAVFENYWNYLRLYNPEVSQRLAEHSPAHAELIESR